MTAFCAAESRGKKDKEGGKSVGVMALTGWMAGVGDNVLWGGRVNVQ